MASNAGEFQKLELSVSRDSDVPFPTMSQVSTADDGGWHALTYEQQQRQEQQQQAAIQQILQGRERNMSAASSASSHSQTRKRGLSRLLSAFRHPKTQNSSNTYGKWTVEHGPGGSTNYNSRFGMQRGEFGQRPGVYGGLM